MAGSATTWKQVMPALSERFTVLVLVDAGGILRPP
jgi:hypothetical protein